MWVLLRGEVQRTSCAILTQPGGAHPNRVAEDKAKATTNSSQLPLCV